MDEINGKTIAVHEVKIDLLIEQQKEVMSMLKEYFKAGGICETSRRSVDGSRRELKAIWTILGLTIPPMFGILVKLAFFK